MENKQPSVHTAVHAHAEKPVRYSPNEHVFRQNDPTIGFFIILSGTVELCRVTRGGTQVVLHRAHSGESFAEASLFSDVYHCDAIARTECELICVSKSQLSDAIPSHGIVPAMIAHLSTQVQMYRLLLQICSIRRADERVLAAMRAGFKPDSWKSFAPQIALSHEAVYRALSSLTKRGLIQREGRGAYRLT